MTALPGDPKERAAYIGRFRDGLMCDAVLTPAAKVVGLGILAHLNRRSDKAWPSRTRLAKTLHISMRTVVRAVPELVNGGWFVREIGTGKRSSRYEINPLRVPEESPICGGTEARSELPDRPRSRANLAPLEQAHSAGSGATLAPTDEADALVVPILHSSGAKMAPEPADLTYRDKQQRAGARDRPGQHQARPPYARHGVADGRKEAPGRPSSGQHEILLPISGDREVADKRKFEQWLGRDALVAFSRDRLNALYSRFSGSNCALDDRDRERAWADHNAERGETRRSHDRENPDRAAPADQVLYIRLGGDRRAVALTEATIAELWLGRVDGTLPDHLLDRAI